MKEQPILFSSEMVRAVIDGRKTQMRRIVKPQPEPIYELLPVLRIREFAVGQNIWVRESAFIAPPNFGDSDLNNCKDVDGRGRVVGWTASMSLDSVEQAKLYGVKQTPSIFMPRWASRIVLEITKVRVNRLQDMSEEDAKAEGVIPICGNQKCTGQRSSGNTSLPPEDCICIDNSARDDYKRLWTSINGAGSWEKNPYVWIISFMRIEP